MLVCGQNATSKEFNCQSCLDGDPSPRYWLEWRPKVYSATELGWSFGSSKKLFQTTQATLAVWRASLELLHTIFIWCMHPSGLQPTNQEFIFSHPWGSRCMSLSPLLQVYRRHHGNFMLAMVMTCIKGAYIKSCLPSNFFSYHLTIAIPFTIIFKVGFAARFNTAPLLYLRSAKSAIGNFKDLQKFQ